MLVKEHPDRKKGFSVQHFLLVMTEKWRNCLHKGVISGAKLTDLSKTFDRLLHDLLLAKYQFLRIMESLFFPTDSKEQKLITPLVVTLKLNMEFQMGQFWVPYFSVSISVTFFLTYSNVVISQVMGTIIHHITLILI